MPLSLVSAQIWTLVCLLTLQLAPSSTFGATARGELVQLILEDLKSSSKRRISSKGAVSSEYVHTFMSDSVADQMLRRHYLQ